MSSVLVVEDESDVRLVARAVLETRSHRVQATDSGEDALEILKDERFQPDVILLDIGLPGIDGWEVLDRLHGENGTHRGVPIVVFSALYSHSEAGLPRALREREYFLAKPFAPRAMLDIVDAATAA